MSAPNVQYGEVPRRRHGAIGAVLLVLAGSLAVGCVRVQAYERGTLSKRCMETDPDPAESMLDGQLQKNREGSIGGSGVSGGGCGCN